MTPAGHVDHDLRQHPRTIGRTPIVRINRLAPEHVTMYVKCEFFNPDGLLGQGSPRDRDHRGCRARGALKPGQTVVEATSGNTGIALAMVCAAKGYPFVATMVETFSIERRKIMRARREGDPDAGRRARHGHGAQGRGAREKHGWFLARQFENPANPAYHRSTTGPEILSDFAGRGSISSSRAGAPAAR
jgi:cysteine synthase A